MYMYMCIWIESRNQQYASKPAGVHIVIPIKAVFTKKYIYMTLNGVQNITYKHFSIFACEKINTIL